MAGFGGLSWGLGLPASDLGPDFSFGSRCRHTYVAASLHCSASVCTQRKSNAGFVLMSHRRGYVPRANGSIRVDNEWGLRMRFRLKSGVAGLLTAMMLAGAMSVAQIAKAATPPFEPDP